MTINLLGFCGSHDYYDINTPFLVNGWSVATDGMILVAVPAAESPDSTGRKLPNAAPMLDKAASALHDDSKWANWPAISYVDGLDACPRCSGEGCCGQDDCLGCRGATKHVCSCGHEHICMACNPTECPSCFGNGKAVFPCIQPVGERRFLSEIDGKVRSLMGVQYANLCDDINGLFLRFFVDDQDVLRHGIRIVMPADRDVVEQEVRRWRALHWHHIEAAKKAIASTATAIVVEPEKN